MADLQSELTKWQDAQEIVRSIRIVDVDVPATILSAVQAEEDLEYEAFLTEAYYGEEHRLLQLRASKTSSEHRLYNRRTS
jgi:nicotinic acid mononucleotide adenylyltransferase